MKDKPASVTWQNLALEQRHQLCSAVFDATTDAVVITDEHAHILAVNQAFTKITGFTKTEVVGQHTSVLSSGRHSAEFNKQFWDTLIESGSWEGEVWNQTKNGHFYLTWLRVRKLQTAPTNQVFYVSVMQDITQLDRAQRELDYIAHHDTLTDLPNRLYLIRVLNQRLNQAEVVDPFAVFFLDLDNFKHINDSLGHEVGDELLRDISQRIHSQLAPDLVAHLGGDEFVILPKRAKSSDFSDVAAAYMKLFTSPFEVQGQELYATVSLGVSLYPNDTDAAEEMVRYADMAMFKAKLKGKNCFEHFKPYMAHVANKRQQIELKFRQALEADSIDVFFQPQFDLSNNRMCGAEVLVRWHEPDLGGWVGPSEFIPIVEKMGLIKQLGDLVLTKLCLQMRKWLNQALTIPLISINVSSFQIDHGDFIEHFLQIVETHQLEPAMFELEITESALMVGWKKVIATMNRLREMGVMIAIDDFGTGYSSLSYLAKMPVQRLKIDQMFIRNIHDSSNDAVLVRMIIALGKALGISVIAEGVETTAQLMFLKNAGCGQSQGFYHAKALPVDQFEAMLREQKL